MSKKQNEQKVFGLGQKILFVLAAIFVAALFLHFWFHNTATSEIWKTVSVSIPPIATVIITRLFAKL